MAIPVAEVATEQPPMASPPMPSIQGYSSVKSQLTAPPVAFPQENNVAMVPIAYTAETINEESMRAALAELVKSKIFWGKGAVKQMTISDIHTWNTYYCTWETFMESRETKWKHRPFKGGMIDGMQNGYPPQPWDINVQYPAIFQEDTVKIAVPHTEQVQQCTDCFGRGHKQCSQCYGVGRINCSFCSGSGHRMVNNQRERCTHCDGTGRRRCIHCNGDGMEKCRECDGSGQIVNYVQLKVKFQNHLDEEIIDMSGLPAEVVRKSVGTPMCQQNGYHILPPQDVFEPVIRDACSRLYQRAESRIMENKERLLQQRVRVTVIPVAKAVGTWKNKSCEFWVHGNNKVAYAPRYAKEFYHGCSIM